jgi:uncharacterized protein YfaS (alpha-2-macroglobulin family)
VRQHQIVDLGAGANIALAAATGDVRQGSYTRSVVLASDPSLVRLVGGVNYLVEYPFNCTEQQIALASAGLALKSFAPILEATALKDRIATDVRTTMATIERATDPDGLIAFWPQARGTISLTSWAYRFIVAAEKAGEPVDKKLKDRLANVLKLALRSDYARLLNGEEVRERVEALTALGFGGKLDEAYVAELSRRAATMPNASVAQMTSAVASLKGNDQRVLAGLMETLWSRVQILAREGRPYYAGLAAESGNPLILPSEVRSLSEITRAVALAAPEDARLGVLRDGLMRSGDGGGWGSTNANAAAIQALAEVWQRPATSIPVTLTRGGASEQIVVNADAPVARNVSTDPAELRIRNGGAAPVVALIDTRYQPAEPGFRAQPVTQGFVLTRQLFRVRSGAPPERLAADADGAIRLNVGDVVEETVELVNPEDRTHVAIALPLAAGFDPLNPNLATAAAEAAPSAGPTLAPAWTSFGDDRVFYAYDRLPRGNYRFVFRTRALIAGTFTQPPGEAETMYRTGIYGASAGQRIVISR